MDNAAANDGQGGGLYSHDSDLMFSDCTFSSNSAGYGGGLSLYNTNGTDVEVVSLTDCNFTQNSCKAVWRRNLQLSVRSVA